MSAFPPELFAFLTDLKAHNDRDWFNANKDRYERHVLEPALDFVEAMVPRLDAISPHFLADPRRTGGSLFRIHRDTRFSKDKSPYKTTVGLFFRHERAKETAAPGFYLHLAPGDVFAGSGIWHPDPPALKRIREAIAAEPDAWRAATGGQTVIGHGLKRAPKGFDPGHPLIEDIKRKDFGTVARLSERDATRPGFDAEYARLCASALPFMRFLGEALDVPV
jgi:uncharacterized protein (TIGR02453 family)